MNKYREGVGNALFRSSYMRRTELHGFSVGSSAENYFCANYLPLGSPLRLLTKQQYRIGRYRLDFAWPSLMVCLEIDGLHHDSDEAVVRDARRDRLLRDKGWTVLRARCESDDFDERLKDACDIIHALHWWRARYPDRAT